MVGVARLRYLPETSSTEEWRREVHEKGEAFIEGYERLSAAHYPDSDIKVRSK
jgi:hypothetical protein